MELGAMVGAWGKGDYDAVLFRITHDSADPARAQEFWMSSGAFHVWHPGQAAPATPWEAAIDEHMRRQATTTDGARRREAFGAAQRVFAAELPVLYFAAPRVLVATSTRVGGAVPAVVPPPVLWNAEALFVVPRSGARR
jgi:peptide/nickel transport system substrate-binding protein